MERNDITKIWLTDDAVWVRLADGREACERFSDYPRLRHASPEERAEYTTDYFGIHWPLLDEDLGFDGFFTPKPDNRLYRVFMEHPELNASAVARRLGMAQSLLAAYISGAKKPSREREETILSAIREIGAGLQSV